MPLYDYHCPECGMFSTWGTIQDPHADAACPSCGQAATRQISAPSLAIMSADTRRAHERNEKSAHEPVHRRRSSCGCSGSHTCGTGAKSAAADTTAATDKPALQMQTKASARPWMLGH